MTFNPVWGCNNNCEYCYARGIAKRFWANIYIKEVNYQIELHPDWAWTGDHLTGLEDFKPTFLITHFKKKFPKKPQRIFVGSMSEIYYWEKEWMERVLDKIRQYPQHTFQFLTKFAHVYNKYTFPNNCWLGITITENYDFERQECYLDDFRYKWHTFISFEPLLEEIYIGDIEYLNVDWVIIGAETGNRKDKVIPKKEWVWDIVNYCKTNNIPVYLKDSIIKLFPGLEAYKQFPKNKGGD